MRLLLVCSFLMMLAGASQAKPFVATVWPMKFLCDEITGKPEQCEVLLDPGLSPHTFEPKPSQMKQLKGAKLMIMVGEGLDPWAKDLAKDIKRVALLDLLPREKLLLSSDPHLPVGKAVMDPHFWLDPTLMRAAVSAVTPAFCSAMPSDCDIYKKNSAKWQDELLTLNSDLQKKLTEVSTAPFLVYHPFLDYFVAQFHLRQVAKVEPESGHEPGPKYLSDVLATARKTNAKVIVTSPHVPARAVKVITDAAQLQIAVLDDIGGSVGRKTYRDLMRYNVETLIVALKAKAR